MGGFTPKVNQLFEGEHYKVLELRSIHRLDLLYPQILRAYFVKRSLNRKILNVLPENKDLCVDNGQFMVIKGQMRS